MKKPLSVLLIWYFSNKQYNFWQPVIGKKCSSSIQCWDSNPQPLEHKSPPLTTRPRLLSQVSISFNLIWYFDLSWYATFGRPNIQSKIVMYDSWLVLTAFFATTVILSVAGGGADVGMTWVVLVYRRMFIRLSTGFIYNGEIILSSTL